MDPNRKLIEACFDTNEESSIAYANYHGMIEDYFCKDFMMKSPFKQGINLTVLKFKIHHYLKATI